MKVTQLSSNLLVLHGAVNTGVLKSGQRAVLFDCCDSVTPEILASLGVRQVDWIFCTQHRRPNAAGIYGFPSDMTALAIPVSERHLFENVDSYWSNWRNRWHIYHQQPSTQILPRPVTVTRTLCEGDTIEWQGHTIRVLDTPGATDGSISYLVDDSGIMACFSGDVLYGSGKLWDLYSLQKSFSCVDNYHGFLGGKQQLVNSLHKLAASGADVLVPSHGEVICDPPVTTQLTIDRLERVWSNYTSISALNFYYPQALSDTRDDPSRMVPAPTRDMPPFIRRVAFTSFAVISDSGAALLIDCGHDSVVQTLQGWINAGEIQSIDGCWVTHYHDDHVDSLYRLFQTFDCPITTDQHMAEIVEQPRRFFFPCISPNPAPVAHKTKDGDSWQWQEFCLTAVHFPGQSLYHGGLLVEGHDTTVFFVGDSFAPTGGDDYCAGNRNFLRQGHGLRRCVGILRRYRPEYIVNQHQEHPFTFSDQDLNHLENVLIERERLLAELLPWSHPDFGTDEWWVRAYPYEQEAAPGAVVAVDVQFTNHGDKEAHAAIEPVLPDAWSWEKDRGISQITVPPHTSGTADSCSPNSDVSARVWIRVPDDALPGLNVIPFQITWDGRYLGQMRHALVLVR